MVRFAALCLSAALLAATGFAGEKRKGPEDIGVSDPGKGVNFYSLEKELILGRDLAREVEAESRLVYDAVVTEYVNRLGQSIVRNSDARTPFVIKVIDTDEVNAFALPGGFLFVNTGLLMQARSEAELAGVLAHEIAHVAARHSAKQATRGELLDYATIPLIFFGWAGFAAREAVGFVAPAGLMGFSRGMEKQADLLGVAYMYKAGYDPTAYVDFLERIESLEKQSASPEDRPFAAHPRINRRIKAVQREIDNGLEPLPQYVLDTSEFQQIRARLIALEERRKSGLIIQITPRLRSRPW